jgi:hypothetical protein
MLNDNEAIPQADPTVAEPIKFPYLHLFGGLIISFLSFIFLVAIYDRIVLTFFPYIGSSDSRLLETFKAYAIPEGLILLTIIWLANRNRKNNELGNVQSYIAMAVINVICFCFVCYLMGTIEC